MAEILEEHELVQRLNTRWYGDARVKRLENGLSDLRNLDGILIIRGVPILPVAKTVVQEFELP